MLSGSGDTTGAALVSMTEERGAMMVARPSVTRRLLTSAERTHAPVPASILVRQHIPARLATAAARGCEAARPCPRPRVSALPSGLPPRALPRPGRAAAPSLASAPPGGDVAAAGAACRGRARQRSVQPAESKARRAARALLLLHHGRPVRGPRHRRFLRCAWGGALRSATPRKGFTFTACFPQGIRTRGPL